MRRILGAEIGRKRAKIVKIKVRIKINKVKIKI